MRMTKQQEQRMNDIFGDYINERNLYEESISDAFKYGYEAAMKEAEVLVEALGIIQEFSTRIEHSRFDSRSFQDIAKEALKKFKGE